MEGSEAVSADRTTTRISKGEQLSFPSGSGQRFHGPGAAGEDDRRLRHSKITPTKECAKSCPSWLYKVSHETARLSSCRAAGGSRSSARVEGVSIGCHWVVFETGALLVSTYAIPNAVPVRDIARLWPTLVHDAQLREKYREPRRSHHRLDHRRTAAG